MISNFEKFNENLQDDYTMGNNTQQIIDLKKI